MKRAVVGVLLGALLAPLAAGADETKKGKYEVEVVKDIAYKDTDTDAKRHKLDLFLPRGAKDLIRAGPRHIPKARVGAPLRLVAQPTGRPARLAVIAPSAADPRETGASGFVSRVSNWPGPPKCRSTARPLGCHQRSPKTPPDYGADQKENKSSAGTPPG